MLSGIVILESVSFNKKALAPILVTSLPPIFDGIESVEAFPVYLWISTVPSLSTLYS